MVKQLHHRSGFTLVEMLIVLAIISIMLFITVTNPIKLYTPQNIDDQITLLTSKIDYYQALAIKKKKTVLIAFRSGSNTMRIEIQNERENRIISLNPLQLEPTSNLNYIAFNRTGEIMKFGKLNFKYGSQHFSIIFHIEQGRYRIIKQ
ncbi:competence type IV pilus minor pilin ComGD [Staphylococcus americanisciuri]|uniref:Competence type IV pilus minor pilin ComGD n=1 Tax=Staphylococcus americanisciuri TaxID=2973940 RepID=A0ABT2EZ78_9STAP|nr:competence type IV pilus minor pilin ComGD [Staphylococcus americanisciuri]MCS4485523.1 competence type IV pilus minor pilin ComGD [Staphylococcus americanisciuri]